ncbi:MAG: DUF4265 domain-containing protein [Betaproteobacteria bacterium]
MSDENLVKVVLCQEYDDEEEAEIESPWALPLGNNKYQLKNFPFMYYGISYDDIFEALPQYEDDPRPYLTKVLEKSGHKTVRVLLNAAIDESQESKTILSTLSKMGCGYEGNGAKFFVINIQPHCDFEKVCDYLSESNLEWEHADPRYKELYPDEE